MIYVYYDKNGILKELVNETNARRGSSKQIINVYYEDYENISGMTAFAKIGTASNLEVVLSNIVVKQIPSSKTRNFKYFEENKPYQFYVFELGLDILQHSGLCETTISAIYDSEESLKLGLLTFNIENNAINIDNLLTYSQYEYLINIVGIAQNDFITISQKVDTFDTRITDNTNDISSLETRMSNAESNVQRNTEQISTNITNIETNATNISRLQQNTTFLEREHVGIKARITENEDDIMQLQNDYDNLAEVAKTGSYNDLQDLPEIPTKVSDITNDLGFITNAVQDLVNYYTKTDTYTKTEINNLFSGATGIRFEIVASLDNITTPSENVIYLVGTQSPYEEYVYIASIGFELIGSSDVDLSEYTKKSGTLDNDTILVGTETNDGAKSSGYKIGVNSIEEDGGASNLLARTDKVWAFVNQYHKILTFTPIDEKATLNITNVNTTIIVDTDLNIVYRLASVNPIIYKGFVQLDSGKVRHYYLEANLDSGTTYTLTRTFKEIPIITSEEGLGLTNASGDYVLGKGSNAFGDTASASGEYASALSGVAGGRGSVAVGHGSNASADYSVAVGKDSGATAVNSVAVGNFSKSVIENAVSFDSPSVNRDLMLNNTDNIKFRNENVDTTKTSFSSYENAETLTDILNEIDGKITAKQDTLVSGTSIKTINNESILGSGNIEVGDVKIDSSSSFNDGQVVVVSDSGNKLIESSNIKTINGNSLLGSGDITIESGGGGLEYVDNVPIDITEETPSLFVVGETLYYKWQKEVKVYGVDGIGASSPTLTRTDDNADLTATSSELQSFFVADTNVVDSNGNAFVKMKKFYMCITQNSDGSQKWQVSNEKANDNFFLHPFFYDKDGNEIDYAYYGKYKGNVARGVLKSVSGATPTYSTAGDSYRTYARANGSNEYHQTDWATVLLAQVMFMIVYATTKYDSVFTMRGYGATTGSGVQFFGIEDLVGNGFEFVDGITYSAGTCYYKNYVGEYSGVITSGNSITSIPTDNGYQQQKMYLPNKPVASIFPTLINGSETTYLCDQFYGSTSSQCSTWWGSDGSFAYGGLFFLFCYGSWGDALSGFGARLFAKKLI